MFRRKNPASPRPKDSTDLRPTYSGLGARVEELIRLAEEQAAELMQAARSEADALTSAARAEAAAFRATTAGSRGEWPQDWDDLVKRDRLPDVPGGPAGIG
jgi:hypothetical protein